MSTVTYACGCVVEGRNPPAACPLHGTPRRSVKRRAVGLSLLLRR